MMSVVIHDYDKVTLDKIGQVIQRDLPILIPQVQNLLKEFGYNDHE